mmetsp:Transcript_5378/g.17682  ORF Transcript_5378/g.17682 Transcript_5378/m.17682 type:complete len:207 (-) Transcript_5378:76-696(-)
MDHRPSLRRRRRTRVNRKVASTSLEEGGEDDLPRRLVPVLPVARKEARVRTPRELDAPGEGHHRLDHGDVEAEGLLEGEARPRGVDGDGGRERDGALRPVEELLRACHELLQRIGIDFVRERRGVVVEGPREVRRREELTLRHVLGDDLRDLRIAQLVCGRGGAGPGGRKQQQRCWRPPEGASPVHALALRAEGRRHCGGGGGEET